MTWHVVSVFFIVITLLIKHLNYRLQVSINNNLVIHVHRIHLGKYALSQVDTHLTLAALLVAVEEIVPLLLGRPLQVQGEDQE